MPKVHTEKSKLEILQNIVAFSEYMTFKKSFIFPDARWRRLRLLPVTAPGGRRPRPGHGFYAARSSGDLGRDPPGLHGDAAAGWNDTFKPRSIIGTSATPTYFRQLHPDQPRLRLLRILDDVHVCIQDDTWDVCSMHFVILEPLRLSRACTGFVVVRLNTHRRMD